MKALSALLLLVLIINLQAQTAVPTANAPRQIITENMIKESGVTSISDLLTLVNRVNYSGIDGSPGLFSMNNLSVYGNQNVLVLVDGQPVETGIFDVQNLDLLPLSLNQVDYVEFFFTPQIYLSTFAQSGMIYFHTKMPAEGLSLQGAHTLGDETGDPGPLSFTELTSPNVDRLVQLFSLNADAGGSDWYMKGSIKHEETFETDPAINNRISFLNKDDNKARLITYRFNLNARLLNGNQQFTAASANNNDFFFFKPYGNEIPVKQVVRQFSFNGNSEHKDFGINYFANYSVHELGYVPNTHEVNFDFGLKNIAIGIEGFYKAGLFTALFGLANNRYDASTNSPIWDKNITIRNFYIQSSYLPADNITASLGVFASRIHDKYAFKGLLQTELLINRKNSLFSAFSFIQSLPEENNSYWIWRQRGYMFNFAEDNFITPLSLGKKETFTADVIYSFRPDSIYTLNAGINFRSFSNFYLEKQFFQFDEKASTFSSLIEILPGEELKTAGAYASLDFRINSKTEFVLSYNYNFPVNGSKLFKEKWQTFPGHSAKLDVYFRPFNNFGVSARMKYFSSSSWYDYKFISYPSEGQYNPVINPKFIIDLSGYLWLWEKRIWLNAVVKNLFNQPEKYHPIGADLDFRFYFQVHFYFNSLLK